MAEMAILYSKDLTTAKKKVTSRSARPDARDYCWVRSPMPNQMMQVIFEQTLAVLLIYKGSVKMIKNRVACRKPNNFTLQS